MKGRKGMMGIGTLIIFIAIILVAAVASMVLIQTSGSLQQRSLKTGKQTEKAISTGVTVTAIDATNGNDSKLDVIEMTCRLRSGSSPVKLSNTLITMDTQYVFQRLNYGGTDTQANTTHYNVTYLQKGAAWLPGYIGDGDVVKIAWNISKTGGQSEGLGEDEEVRIYIIPRRGQSTYISFITPEIIKKERIVLYP